MTFDEKFDVQNVRVINQTSWMHTATAVAVGVVAGMVGALIVLAALGQSL